MLPDFHVHTEFSADSDTPVTDQIERAIELGMKTICFTDHHDIDAPVSNFIISFRYTFSAAKNCRIERAIC